MDLSSLNQSSIASERTFSPYQGAFADLPLKNISTNKKQSLIKPGQNKLQASLKQAIIDSGLQDGMTISFHHHFRQGDKVVGMVLEEIRALGIKGLKFAPSAVINISNPSLVDFIIDGTINRIEASGIRGDLGNAVMDGILEQPVILRSHGGRPRAVQSGDLTIDLAFIGVSAADSQGNCNGTGGQNICGALGYPIIDAIYAAKVIAITDTIVSYPCLPASIKQSQVDYVVEVEAIGDAELIGKGAARLSKNPRDLLIAKMIAEIIANCDLFKENFTFQTGAGAIAIACTKFIGDKIREQGIKAGFILGGVTSSIIDLLAEDLVKNVFAVQSFDAVAAKAMLKYPQIIETDADLYANPHNLGCMANNLDFVVLGALEVDLNFNVNILTGASGEMLGGLGGGPDVAAAAKVPIVALPLMRGRTPSIVKKVFTCCTPGDTIAVIVTEAGIALNPNHPAYQMLKDNLAKTRLKIFAIEQLHNMAIEMTGTPKPIETLDKVVALVEYRDGTIIDVIKQLKR